MRTWIVLLHVGAAFWFVAGLAGRDVTLAKAASSQDVGLVAELAELAGRFDKWMVIPGSIAVLLLGVTTVLAQGRSFAGTDGWWVLTSLVLFLSLIPLVPLVFVPRGRVFERALSDALAKDEVTPELTAALNDGAARAARMYERIVVIIIIVLMVTKPF